MHGQGATARPCRHAVGDRWQVDETYVKVAGQWHCVYRAVGQFGQVIDMLVSLRRDAAAARRFFRRPSARCGPHQSRWSPTTRRCIRRCSRAATGGLASHRPVCQQPYRGRPRPPQGVAGSDARAQAGPQRQGRDRRGMAWCRICDEATTSSRSRSRWPGAWRHSVGGRIVRPESSCLWALWLGNPRPQELPDSLCRRGCFGGAEHQLVDVGKAAARPCVATGAA
jgi:hypothetical protein